MTLFSSPFLDTTFHSSLVPYRFLESMTKLCCNECKNSGSNKRAEKLNRNEISYCKTYVIVPVNLRRMCQNDRSNVCSKKTMLPAVKMTITATKNKIITTMTMTMIMTMAMVVATKIAETVMVKVLRATDDTTATTKVTIILVSKLTRRGFIFLYYNFINR